MDLSAIALIAAAGATAGAANTIAGGGTLISFPALLAVGLPPITANVTSAVGLVPGYAGGAYAYRRELSGQRRRFLSLLAVSAVGGVLGALLLLVTPADAFRTAVPYLVLMSCGLLLAQPRLAALVARRTAARAAIAGRSGGGHRLAVMAAASYGSYFGAGLGVLLLAVLGIFIPDTLQRLNGLKSLLSLVVVGAGVSVFLLSGQVDLGFAVVLLASSWLGGLYGGRFGRRLSPQTLRYLVCSLGILVAVVLLVRS